MVDITLIQSMHDQLRMLKSDFHRYIYNEIPEDARLVGLTGPRGVGKSTLVLQKIKESDKNVCMSMRTISTSPLIHL